MLAPKKELAYPPAIPENRPYVFYFLILLLAGLAAWTWWSFRPQSLLLGTWRNSQGDIEIFSNGTISIKNPQFPASGSYQILDDNSAKVDLEGIAALAGPLIINYQVSANQLVLTYNNSPESFSRVSNPPFPVFIFSLMDGLFTSSKTVQVNGGGN
jgi:hypothetical protein